MAGAKMNAIASTMKTVFTASGFVTQMVGAYVSVLRFMEAGFGDIASQHGQAGSMNSSAVRTNVSNGTAFDPRDCGTPEVVIDYIFLVAFTILFFAHYYKSDFAGKKWWPRRVQLITKTLLFAVYLMAVYDQPLICNRSSSSRKDWRISQGVLLIAIAVATLPAILPDDDELEEQEEEGLSLKILEEDLTGLCKTTHSDMFLYTFYHITIKFTQDLETNDPTKCSDAGEAVAWTVFAVVVVWFKFKHYLKVVKKNRKTCSTTFCRWGIETNFPKRNRCWVFSLLLLRTFVFLVYLFCSHPQPISCALRPDQLKTLSWVQSGVIGGVTFLMTLLHGTPPPE